MSQHAVLAQKRIDGSRPPMDRFGAPIVMLRDHSTWLRAAAIPLRRPTPSLRAATADFALPIEMRQLDPGLGRLPNIVPMAGGVPIETGGSVVGAVEMSGAPWGDEDEACDRTGLDAVRDKIDFWARLRPQAVTVGLAIHSRPLSMPCQ